MGLGSNMPVFQVEALEANMQFVPISFLPWQSWRHEDGASLSLDPWCRSHRAETPPPHPPPTSPADPQQLWSMSKKYIFVVVSPWDIGAICLCSITWLILTYGGSGKAWQLWLLTNCWVNLMHGEVVHCTTTELGALSSLLGLGEGARENCLGYTFGFLRNAFSNRCCAIGPQGGYKYKEKPN